MSGSFQIPKTVRHLSVMRVPPNFSEKDISCSFCPIHENTLLIMKFTKDGLKIRVAVSTDSRLTSAKVCDPIVATIQIERPENVVPITTGLVWFPPLIFIKFTLRVSTRRARHTTSAAVGGDLLPTHFQHFLANLHLTKNSHEVR